MFIKIVENDPAPIYVQIMNQIKLHVYSGRLKPEQELPSIRALAEQLVVNPNTVARAYRDLEAEGIVSKKRTTGCYVSADAGAVRKGERIELLREKAEALLADARQLDLSAADLARYIDKLEQQRAKEVRV